MGPDLVFVGYIRSQYKRREECPKQPEADMPCAILEIDKRFLPAMEGLREGEQIVVLTWLHKGNREILKCHPRGNTSIPKRGIFSTRSPDRPNPIGLHEVTILSIEDNRLTIHPIEVMDNTPVIDIKPMDFELYKKSWGPGIDVAIGQEIKEVGYKGWLRGLFSGYSGNISVRQDNTMIITRSGCNKSFLAPGDLVVFDMETNTWKGNISSEWQMHVEIYKKNPKVRAIVHTHPPYLLAAVAKDESFLERLRVFETEIFKQEIGMVEPISPGTRELAMATGEIAKTKSLIILKSHGLVAATPTMERALSLSEELEGLAKIFLLGG